MEPQETDASPQMRILETLSPEAEAHLKKVAEDGFSLKDFLPRQDYWKIAGKHIYFPLDLEGLSSYIGIDTGAPLGAKTPCVVCISALVCNLAAERYPKDENLNFLINTWADLEDAMRDSTFSKKRPSEIFAMKRAFHAKVFSWGVEEIRRLHNVFSGVLASLGDHPETYFIPRYVARIYMREKDGELCGQIQKKGEKDVRSGSFVAISVSPMTCFSRIVFSLGLKPGYHVCAGCGNSDHYGDSQNQASHLSLLRNFRMKLKESDNRKGGGYFEGWGTLYAQTYESANEIKKLNDAEPPDPLTLEDCWSALSSKTKSVLPKTVWVTGPELEKKLDTHDQSTRHTMRMLTLAPSIDGTWEIIMVVERGDQKTGGSATRRTGKPPAWGIPGGMVEKQEMLGGTGLREFSNETQTKSSKILALFAETRKNRIPGALMDNVDHWLVAIADREACSTKSLIERPEIYKVYRIPLDQLATFNFQDTKRPVWDLDRIDRERLLYPNHAVHLIVGLPLIVEKGIFPGLKLPDNFHELEKNLKRFQDNKRGYC